MLTAPPGAGKSTVLPLALLDAPWLRGRSILMLEPRRLAARAVAARMAQQLGEALGETVGYRIRFESKVSARTRIEVLTEGILTRRLQHDAALDGVGLVIFDEFHERSLNADLALALCRESQSALRDDLRILIMSATLDAAALCGALDDAPAVEADGRPHPVTLRYAEREPDGPLPFFVADAVTRALAEEAGDVLAFLPGVGEITRAQDVLEARHPDLRICPLYGDQSLDAQQAAIQPARDGVRRVVLATAIAETSLTIEGVRVVIDCGYARVPRFDPRSGLTGLETVRITRDSADQRAGRAGRLGPGIAYRLWTPATQMGLRAVRTPEILEADLAPLRLELAQWGAKTADALRWITPPPAGAWQQAEALLNDLGALDNTVMTRRGRALAELPTHPRLANMLLADGHPDDIRVLACDIAALLDERDPLTRGSSADLTLRVEALRHWRATQRTLHGADARALARIERLALQWRQQLRLRADNATPDAMDVGLALSLAYPDRVAQTRGGAGHRYRLANGRGAALSEGDPLQAADWLAIAHADGGDAEGRIYLAAPLDPRDVEARAQWREVLAWDAKQGVLIARRERRVGELVLESKPLTSLPADQKARVLCDVLRREGLSLLSWDDATRQWQARAQSLHVWNGSDWPDVSDDALLHSVDTWLPAWLDRVTRRDHFKSLDLPDILSSLISPQQLRLLASLAPTHLSVPSGSSIRLEYFPDGAAPVLAVKLQEIFGLEDTPAVNNGRMRVLCHLLSPAQRPIQITQDLRSFWHNTYPQVRKELRGRYIKHPWPEDPWNAVPTRRTVRGHSNVA